MGLIYPRCKILEYSIIEFSRTFQKTSKKFWNVRESYGILHKFPSVREYSKKFQKIQEISRKYANDIRKKIRNVPESSKIL